MAKVVAVAAGKGGVGKTTTAVNVAACLAEYSKRVLLVDADPQKSGSAEWWTTDDEGEFIEAFGFSVAKDVNPELLGQLRDIDDYDIVVVDTPPRLGSAILRAVGGASDLIICPTVPEGAEILAAIETVNGFPPGRTTVLLTQVDSRSMAKAEQAMSAMFFSGVPAFDTYVRLYTAHRQARAGHLPITALRHEPAAADYRNVTKEVAVMLDIKLKDSQ